MAHRTLLLVISFSIVLSLAACGSRGDDATPAPAEPAAAQSGDTQSAEDPAAAPTKAPEPTVAAEPIATQVPTSTPVSEEEEALSLADRSSGLGQLRSYRLKWVSEWVPDDATKDPMTMEWTQEYVADPSAQYLEWRATNLEDAPAEETMLSRMWRIGPTTYMLMGAGDEAQCIGITQEEDVAEPPFDPSLLGGLEGAKYAGRETVNGIRTKHYTYDKIAFTLLGADSVSGEVWVADDGGYMVKEVLAWEGSGGPFTSQTEDKGKGTWTWELTDVNEPITIEPPEECLSPAGQADLPVLPDAQSRMQSPMGTQYASKTSVADAVKFYQAEMPAAGWQPEDEPTIMGEIAMLSYVKDDQKVSIMITGDGEGGSMVIVSMGE